MTVFFDYQSRNIHYIEWIDLITLCLTPLIAHIVAGVPSPTILQPTKPRWHDRIGLFNPTSILWRYFAIMDRGIRAKSWTAMSMAASNAVFWTTPGWDGSASMISQSRAFCMRQPTETHVRFFSGTTVKTIIVGLQGFAAIDALLMGIISPVAHKYADLVSISYVFVPLTIFGLFRLPITFWLSEDFSFADHEMIYGKVTEMGSVSKRHVNTVRDLSTESLLDTNAWGIPDREEESEAGFYAIESWRGRLVRITFLGLLLALWGVTLFYLSPRNGRIYTTTTLSINLFYLLWLSSTVAIIGWHFWSGNSETTIIPCASKLWYKLYTVSLTLFAVGIMVVAGMETRMTPCGKYTLILCLIMRRYVLLCQ